MKLGKYKIDPNTLEPVLASSRFLRPLLFGGALVVVFVIGWLSNDFILPSIQNLILTAEKEGLQEQLLESRQRVGDLSKQLDNLTETDRELYRLILQADSIPYGVRQVGVGGMDPYAHFDAFTKSTSQLLRDHAESLDELERRISLQSDSYAFLETLAIKRKEALAQLPTIKPALGRLASDFGWRLHPILHYHRMHSGIDIAVAKNTPVYATGGGIIEEVGYSKIGYGRYILIDHPAAGYKTLYGHLNSTLPKIRKGARVVRGEQIALSGNTGLSVAPHVHYEVRDQNNEPLNPIYFWGPSMSPQQYQELLNRAKEYSNLPSLD